MSELVVKYKPPGIFNPALYATIVSPDTEGLRPAIIFVHGGGWVIGDRSALLPAARVAASLGFVGMTIDYTLARIGGIGTQWPRQILDVELAIAWLRQHHLLHGVDPQRIALWGGSAGGHLSLMAAYRGNCAVHAVCNFFGVADMVRLYATTVDGARESVIPTFMGGKPTEKPDAYRDASPVFAMTEAAPPVFTQHGGLDMMVPVEQAYLLKCRALELGVRHKLRIYACDTHGLRNSGEKPGRKAFKWLQELLG